MSIKGKPNKRVVISEENMSEELKEELKARYPLGMSDSMIRITKPNGEFFYGVVLEMPDVTYLVKLKVKVDKSPAEDIDKELFEEAANDELKNAEDVAHEEEDESEE